MRPIPRCVGEFIGHAAAAFTRASAAGDGRAVEIALGVERDAFVGLASVGAAGKAVEDRVNPGEATSKTVPPPKVPPCTELP